MPTGSLFQDLPTDAAEEVFDTLITANGVTIERIVSTGQATPPGDWYDQGEHEFVVVLAGRAWVRLEAEASDRELAPGDWLWLPARCRHRVTRTTADPATVWLAVFVPAGQ